MREVAMRIYQQLESFLGNYVPSDGGGWAPVTEEDLEKFHTLIASLIQEKWGADADGDRPINFILIDRTKYWPMHYSPVLYAHHDCPEEERKMAFRERLANLSRATEDIECHIRSDELEEGLSERRAKKNES